MRLGDALARDGWRGGVAAEASDPTVIHGLFLRDFGGWTAVVVLATDPTAQTVALSGMVQGSTYCTPRALD